MFCEPVDNARMARDGDAQVHRLREIRKARGLTQEKLGEMVDLDGGVISDYERHTRTLQWGPLEKLADALDVSVDQIMCRAPFKPDLGPPILLNMEHARAAFMATLIHAEEGNGFAIKLSDEDRNALSSRFIGALQKIHKSYYSAEGPDIEAAISIVQDFADYEKIIKKH